MTTAFETAASEKSRFADGFFDGLAAVEMDRVRRLVYYGKTNAAQVSRENDPYYFAGYQSGVKSRPGSSPERAWRKFSEK